MYAAGPEFAVAWYIAGMTLGNRDGYELYFDPTSNDFVLAYSGSPPSTFNVRGDAVGCFMAR